jgi:hypothetical protein
VLAFVARRVRSDPLLMLFGIRTGHDDLVELSDLSTIDLTPLGRADAAALLDARTPDLDARARAWVLDVRKATRWRWWSCPRRWPTRRRPRTRSR